MFCVFRKMFFRFREMFELFREICFVHGMTASGTSLNRQFIPYAPDINDFDSIVLRKFFP